MDGGVCQIAFCALNLFLKGDAPSASFAINKFAGARAAGGAGKERKRSKIKLRKFVSTEPWVGLALVKKKYY